MKPQSSPAKPGKYLRTKSNANRLFPGTFVLTLLLLFAGMCFFSARWYLKTYGYTGFDSILYPLTADLEGVQTGLVVSFSLKALLPALLFTLLGEVLAALIPFPIPAAIYGLVLMLIALLTGLLKPDHIKEASSFLISVMPVLFVPPAVRILEYWGIVGPNMAAILIIAVFTTFLVFAVSGLVTQFIIKKKGDKNNG